MSTSTVSASTPNDYLIIDLWIIYLVQSSKALGDLSQYHMPPGFINILDGTQLAVYLCQHLIWNTIYQDRTSGGRNSMTSR
jgi:hypothetical protein